MGVCVRDELLEPTVLSLASLTKVLPGMGNSCSSCWPWKKAYPNQNETGLQVVKRPSTVPSTAQYVSKTGKSVVQMLKAATPLVPVPLVGQVLDVVLALISICEQATALQGQIDDLKDQLCLLGVILVDSVEGEALPPATQTRIAKLRDDLDRIKYDLQEILNQGSVVLGFFADANKGSVDDCVKRLNAALTEFHLSHAITTEQDLHRMLQHLEDMSSQLEKANRGIDEIGGDVKTLIKNQQLHSAPILSPGMPTKLRHFRGREVLMTDIRNMLCSNEPVKPHIAILATGGMGKTTVAVEVMESDMVKRSYENRFWVPCTGATSFALFLQVLAASLRIKTDSGDLQTNINSELTVSGAPRLIVLDNFETPWDTREKNDVETMLCSLARIRHVAIVITMRSNLPPSKQNIDWHVEDLKPLDLGASREIYTDINPSAKDHESLNDLLHALGHMPYAVKLIATLGEESDSPPDALLKIWNERGTRTVGDEIDRSISLSVDSGLLQSHPEALSLLIILSMLPAGASRDHINWWAARLGSNIPLAISTLNRTALISKLEGPSDSPTYFVYPVVQSYMEHSGRILPKNRIDLQEAAFKFILDHRSLPGDPKFKDDLKALATEDINLQGVLTFAARQRMENHGQSNKTFEKTLLDALLTFSLYQLRSKPILDIATLVVDVARYLDSKHHLAEGLDCLGRIRIHLSDYDGAADALKEARNLFNSLSNPLRSVQTAYQLMTSYDLGGNMPAAKALEQELRADLKALNANDKLQLHAIAQLTIALNLIFEGQRQKAQYEEALYQEALEYLSNSQKGFAGLDHSYEGAECLHKLCHCYSLLSKYHESMKAAQLAASEFEYLGLDADRNYVRLLECNLFLRLNDYDQALHVSEALLQESRRLGDILSTACALEYMAQVFEQRVDVAAAWLGYESALEQYKIIGTGAIAQKGMRRCESNLELLVQAMAEGQDNGDIISDGPRLMPQLLHLAFF